MVIYLGDMISYYEKEEAPYYGYIDPSVELFAKNKPFISIRGNHEMRGKLTRNYMNIIGCPNDRFYNIAYYGCTALIMLDPGEDKPDTQPVYAGMNSYDGYRMEQLEWLKKEAATKQFKAARNKIVLIHIPPIVTDDPNSPDMVKALTGVIVYHHKSNAWWDGDGNPVEGQQPDCVSADGITGVGRPGGDCASCPLNTFGSGEGGKGKACKNTERLYLISEGSILPYRINVSPASLKRYRSYKTSQVAKGRKICDVVTEISLKKVTNASGQPYAECVFKCVGLLDPETKALSRKKREEVKALAQSLANIPAAAAASVGAELEAEGFEEVPF